MKGTATTLPVGSSIVEISVDTPVNHAGDLETVTSNCALDRFRDARPDQGCL